MLLAEVNRNEEGDHQIKVFEFFLINKRKIKSGLCQKKYEKVPCHQLRGAFKSKTNKAEKKAHFKINWYSMSTQFPYIPIHMFEHVYY